MILLEQSLKGFLILAHNDDSLQYELFNRYTSDESAMLSECLKDVFDKEHYFQKDWTLGMPHFVPLQVDQTSSSQTESVLNDPY